MKLLYPLIAHGNVAFDTAVNKPPGDGALVTPTKISPRLEILSRTRLFVTRSTWLLLIVPRAPVAARLFPPTSHAALADVTVEGMLVLMLKVPLELKLVEVIDLLG